VKESRNFQRFLTGLMRLRAIEHELR